ncbi:MAG: N-acetylmuramoyl-L-alanine amidase [Phycisphaerales bacterium]|nr:N-acetylmuramoyl-L-alanine amidase [Phycisphaerales bacterium]
MGGTSNKSSGSIPVRRSAQSGRRTQVVWVSLIGAMTAVGGLLLALEDRPAAPLAALASTDRTGADLSAIYRTQQPVEKGRWTGIVIHHSGSATGSADTIARQQEARGLLGLGYHFVIANGQGAPDGEVHVGYRWLSQLPGAHASGPKGDQYNRRTIGICLVGDGDRRAFTPAQLQRLAELVASLQKELGIPADQVVLHRDIAATASPGRLFPESAFRAALAAVR